MSPNKTQSSALGLAEKRTGDESMKIVGRVLSRLFQTFSQKISHRASKVRLRIQEADVQESPGQSLLRRRIRAAAVVLFVAKAAMALRLWVISGHAAPLDGVILIGLVSTVVSLYSTRNVSVFWLRTLETAVFLGLALQMGLHLHLQLRFLATAEAGTGNANNVVMFVAAMKDRIIATFGMMMIYGMFIPNTSRRAMIMVVLMTVPSAVVIAANESSVDVIEVFRIWEVNTKGLFSSNLFSLAVGAGIVVYGTSMMNRWRTRALEAEQLGQYRLQEKIGSGGMGDVYLAEHRLLKRVCAVKVIRSHLSDDPVMLNRFEREVQATATLTHWNTVQVFDYGHTSEGTFFYVMEHLHGRNLLQLVDEHGPMSESRVVFILRQVCEALREAAAKKLVHRDIKPSNIFLARIGERFDVVKLLDFGLVLPLASMPDPNLSGSNELKGSPRYMCPEQAQGEVPDGKGDIYSLGATAFFLLTGRPPFDLNNTLQLVIAHATTTPPSLSEYGISVASRLEAVIQKCLMKDPADRYHSPDELLEALDQLSVAYDWSWEAAEHWWRDNRLDCDCIPAEPLSVAIRTDVESSTLDDTVVESTATQV